MSDGGNDEIHLNEMLNYIHTNPNSNFKKQNIIKRTHYYIKIYILYNKLIVFI